MNKVKQMARTGLRGTTAVLVGAALLAIGGCDDNRGTTADLAPRAEEAPSPAPSSRPAHEELTVSSGTVLQVEFLDEITSADSAAGDRFSARVVDPVVIDERVAIEPGATVRGRVVEAVPAKKIGGQARLNLEFTSVEAPDGSEVPLEASFHDLAKSQTKKDAATIGGSTAGGALLGRIIGHQRGNDADGTAIGAIVGAAVGTAIAASNRGEDVTIPANTVVSIELTRPLRMTVES